MLLSLFVLRAWGSGNRYGGGRCICFAADSQCCTLSAVLLALSLPFTSLHHRASSPHPAAPSPSLASTQTPVTAANLRQYLSAVVDATLGAGVAAQVAAFRSGFDAIFPLDSLAAFYEDEIEVMLCGE